MAEKITYDVVRNIGVIADNGAWETQVNMISWNHGAPKVDIRKWNVENDRMSKGISLTENEARELVRVLTKYFNADGEDE